MLYNKDLERDTMDARLEADIRIIPNRISGAYVTPADIESKVIFWCQFQDFSSFPWSWVQFWKARRYIGTGKRFIR